MPASLSSFGSRSCSVWNARSERPRACGEKAPICSTPNCASARPTWVGRPRSISPALVGAEIMRAAVGVEAHRQAMLRKHLLQRPEGRGRALLLDEKRRIDRARRVVERDDQIERRLALEPGVPRAVLVQHHARQRPPLALAPVRPLARRLRHNARPLQMQLQPGVAPAEAVILDQMLVEMLDREALVALAIKPLHFLRPVGRDPPARRLAEPAVQSPASPSSS